MTLPRCYAGCGKPIPKRARLAGARFCNKRCAARFGITVADAGLDYWCGPCGRWVPPLECPHRFRTIQEAAEAGRASNDRMRLELGMGALHAR